MKKNAKLPTLFGVLILFLGVVAGVYLINSRQIFKTSANSNASPSNVRFSNISSTGITVSWTTDVESVGAIKWGTSENSVTKIVQEENLSKSFVHSVNVNGLVNSSTTFIKIVSNGKDYDNNGISWQTKTMSQNVNSSKNIIASGSVLSPDGVTPARAVVYFTINGVVLSGITSDKGNYVVSVSKFTEDIPENTAIEITVNAGLENTSQSIIYPNAISYIPTIVVGKTYDFRTITVGEFNETPKSTLSIPETVAISSRFEVQKATEKLTNSSNVTLESVVDGETITTTTPEFFGHGPKNTQVVVSIESELQTADLSVDTNGSWSWSPSNNLESGEHKITLKWKDASGMLKTLTRTFVVQASEGPAFESTPSATPISTESTPTPSIVPTVSSSPRPTPETGDMASTIGLFMMGVGILLSSAYFWNKSSI